MRYKIILTFTCIALVACVLHAVNNLPHTEPNEPPTEPNDYMITWQENDVNGVFMYAYPPAVNDYYLLHLSVDVDCNDFDAWWESIEATHKAQVHVEINGEAKEFTLEQFKRRLGFFDYGESIDAPVKPTFDDLLDANVSAYCPKACCCGRFANGITASGHKIQKGDKFVAAPKEYPFGTMIDIPGYGEVPVLDRGGAIKGVKLDIYFDTHEQALQWGRQYLKVKIGE